MPVSRPALVVRTAVLTLLAAGLVAAAVGFTVLFNGWYNIGATTQHLPSVYKLLEQGMQYSVRKHAMEVVTPPLGQAEVLRGAPLYRDNCAQCHGGPGVATAAHGMSMQPVPGPLVDASRRWRPREIFWITRHGIKMSGMPAWEYHLNEADTWAIVAFINRMQDMSARDYRTLTASPPVRAGDQQEAR